MVIDLLMVQGRNWGGENGGIDNIRPSIDRSKRKKALPGDQRLLMGNSGWFLICYFALVGLSI